MVRDGTVEVRAPLRASSTIIQEFVAHKSAWIHKQIAEQQKKAQQVYQLKDGFYIPYRGKGYSIKIIQGKNSVTLTEQQIVISTKSQEQLYINKLFDRWLLEQAKLYIPSRVYELAKAFGFFERLKGVKFRKTKTKWGHCNSQGLLQFNPLVMLTPDYVIQYLIIHELCHLRHMNHSKAYWQLVDSFMPDYKSAEQWLKNHGYKLNY